MFLYNYRIRRNDDEQVKNLIRIAMLKKKELEHKLSNRFLLNSLETSYTGV